MSTKASPSIMYVALRKESVDRKCGRRTPGPHNPVALRKESVDRKLVATPAVLVTTVALRKESVDRKTDPVNLSDIPAKSLSARRAWIEKTYDGLIASANFVALRKESVDRKVQIIMSGYAKERSLSARRAWIEKTLTVRNVPIDSRRSPQGERG